jgi:hypothetical protein
MIDWELYHRYRANGHGRYIALSAATPWWLALLVATLAGAVVGALIGRL